MTFREKTTWVMIIGLVLSGIFYAKGAYETSLALGETAPPNIGLIAFVTIVIVAFAIFGHAFAALGNPMDADEPEDERDKLIAWRAGNIAGYVLGFIVFPGLWHYALYADGNMFFHIVVMGLVVSQIADYGLSLIFYRQGI